MGGPHVRLCLAQSSTVNDRKAIQSTGSGMTQVHRLAVKGDVRRRSQLCDPTLADIVGIPQIMLGTLFQLGDALEWNL
jgi:hypothetical protein